ncbi:hypothetical protein HBZS_113910 [Helicobacter bizzozeronii CCUG 35545]|nr:hypothetical protein HBZS_113910 [Helicobacter bizzozeronii CCUG 35545]
MGGNCPPRMTPRQHRLSQEGGGTTRRAGAQKCPSLGTHGALETDQPA